MTDQTTDPGFGDHFSLKKDEGRIDPNKRADAKTLDTVWDIIQGKVAVPTEAPLPAGQIEVAVPIEYVDAIGFLVLKELKRRHMTKGFSVKVDPDMPKVSITWERPGGIATPTGNAFDQATNCLAAWMAKLAPEHVAMAAVDHFEKHFNAAMARGAN